MMTDTKGNSKTAGKEISRRELFILSLCHLLVDGICAASLFRNTGLSITDAVLIYNTFAFTTQCLTGMLPDRFGHGRRFVLLSAVILLAGAFVPMPLVIRAVVIGLGNSLFHVSGGYLTLKGSHGMGPLGIFVAPGAIGLFLGTAFPVLLVPFSVLLAVSAVFTAVTGHVDEEPACNTVETQTGITTKERILLAAMLLIAVAARAVGGSSIAFSWKTGLAAAGIMVFFVFLGKTCGGLLADRIGIRKTAILSVAAASVFIILCHDIMPLALIGQFALNLSMPVTLYLIYRLFPDSPGFAFGLAAAALWPGTLAGKLIHLTGIWAGVLTLICFAAGLAAVLITERRLEK